MPARRLTGPLALLAGALAAVLGLAAPAPAGAQEANQALVIVETGAERRSVYVSFTAETISGLEALQLAGAEPVYRAYGTNGLAVCALCGVGCPADGSCLTCQEPNYWAYWRDDAGGDPGFVYSGSGAGSARVGDGDVEGWRWGTGGAPAWQPFDPPEPTTTTATTAPPPTTAPPTTGAPAPTTTATSPPPPPSPGAGAPGPSTSAPSTSAAPPTSGTATSTTVPASSSSTPSPSASTPGSVAAGGSTSGDRSSPDGAGEAVDGDEVAAVAGPAREPGGGSGGSAWSLAGFAVALGAVVAAIAWARRTRLATVAPTTAPEERADA